MTQERANQWEGGCVANSIGPLLEPGVKVRVVDRLNDGFAEIASGSGPDGLVELKYWTSPTESESFRCPWESIRRDELPCETRSYHAEGRVQVSGRAIALIDPHARVREYWVKFPNTDAPVRLKETAFRVRSYLKPADPVSTLASLAHETPFFFDRRSEWLRRYVEQLGLTQGFTALGSAKMELLPHQVEVVRRILCDSVLRYLLADEVGLGKMIECGTILKQVLLDQPRARLAVFVPDVLVPQWKEELTRRFELTVPVLPYAALVEAKRANLDLVAIDEAHRVVATPAAPPERQRLFRAATEVAHGTRHLLLLSATPVLHQEQELVALLHLLDPTSYALGDLEAFRQRLEKRRVVGNLVLQLSRSKEPSMLERHAKRAAAQFPGDEVVAVLARRAAEVGTDVEAARRNASELQAHLSETHRIHRRMIRTRRTLLRSQGFAPALRQPPAAEFEEDSETLAALWRALEEWRIEVAGRTTGLAPEVREKYIVAYFELAQALAGDQDDLRSVAKRLRTGLDYGREELNELLSLVGKRGEGHLELLLSVLRARQAGKKQVVFASSPSTCSRIAHAVEKKLGRLLAVTGQGLAEFRDDPAVRFLVADTSVEEGLNLQFAQGAILYDLPINPMRLEQRIGRLDRINRLEKIPCRVLLTIDDDTIALDTAWYLLLCEGFGLFGADGLADMAFLVEREMERLREVTFVGGPGALAAEHERVRGAVAAEREQAEEQDVIDGLHLGEVGNSALWRGLKAADEGARTFQEALAQYVKGSVGLDYTEVRHGEKIRFFRNRKREEIVPADRVSELQSYFEVDCTTDRELANLEPDLPFLRPGNPFADAVARLAEWDDRGRAWAFWRRAPGREPRLVFRLNVRVGARLDELARGLDQRRGDAVARAATLRLVGSWFSPQFHDLFLNSLGDSQPEAVVKLCVPAYDKRDVNLGAAKARILHELVGETRWGATCREVADKALSKVRASTTFLAAIARAERSAEEHFAMTFARQNARAQRAVDPPAALAADLAAEEGFRASVAELIANPSVLIDSIGIYVLSEQCPCP
jgi:ATP-dependent helicase HepA